MNNNVFKQMVFDCAMDLIHEHEGLPREIIGTRLLDAIQKHDEQEEEPKISVLLNVHNGDFELWSEEKYGFKYYCIGIEGYMGLESIEAFIGLYNIFLDELERYLIENNHTKTIRRNEYVVYKKRAIEIDYSHDCYWIFLDRYESTNIWDTYYYLEDVIEQLKEVEEVN